MNYITISREASKTPYSPLQIILLSPTAQPSKRLKKYLENGNRNSTNIFHLTSSVSDVRCRDNFSTLVLVPAPDMGRAKCNERARYTLVICPEWSMAKCPPAIRNESATWRERSEASSKSGNYRDNFLMTDISSSAVWAIAFG